MKEHKTNWIIHIIIRLLAIPLLFIVVYQIILDGKTDPMGFGMIYAFISVTFICFNYFSIESIVFYVRKNKTKLYCNLFILAFASTGILVTLAIL